MQPGNSGLDDHVPKRGFPEKHVIRGFLVGTPVNAERNTAMPREFLMQQMAWREALDEAADSAAVLALQVSMQHAQH